MQINYGEKEFVTNLAVSAILEDLKKMTTQNIDMLPGQRERRFVKHISIHTHTHTHL